MAAVTTFKTSIGEIKNSTLSKNVEKRELIATAEKTSKVFTEKSSAKMFCTIFGGVVGGLIGAAGGGVGAVVGGAVGAMAGAVVSEFFEDKVVEFLNNAADLFKCGACKVQDFFMHFLKATGISVGPAAVGALIGWGIGSAVGGVVTGPAAPIGAAVGGGLGALAGYAGYTIWQILKKE